MEDNKFIEELFWTSYRYCIGRHSYVTTYAKDMAAYFYDKMTKERKEFTAMDIRRSIADCLSFEPFGFSFDWSIPEKDRLPFETFIEFISNYEFETDDISKELSLIRHISVYKKDGVIMYEVSKTKEPKYGQPIYEHEIFDLLPWMDLASLFDMKNHRIVTYEYDGKVEECEAYESYINDAEEIGNDGPFVTYKPLPWKYKKVYRPISNLLGNSYIDPSLIKDIKPVENNE